ncbi:MAG: ABC transporter substrate-binding protein [Thermodesulfobacteriota bacterium]|nr:ABC transporter substrate-binding protein [Thermodesulfobacteriota bacterium]
MKRLNFQVFMILGFIMSLLLFPKGNTAYCKEARQVKGDVLKIGAIIDLTGPTSNVGVVMIEAYKNFIRHINEEGGLYGRKIKLIVEDDRYSIPAGIAAFKKLLFRDQVLALMGPISIGETKVLFRHIEKNKIPTLPWAPDKSIMDPYKRYIFPTNGFYDNEWGVILDYIMNELKPKNPKIALATVDVESGKVVKELADKWAGFHGLKLHHETVSIDAMDVTSQVLTMKRAGITHILLHHVAPGAAAILKELRKFGMNIPLFGTSAACTEDVIRICGETSKNFWGASAYSSWYDDTPGMEKVREISMKYNPDAEKSYRIKSYSWGWVIPVILQEGLKRAGKDLDGDKLVSALETIRDLDTKGICGPITYTPTIHYGLNYNKIFKADPSSGKLDPMTDWRLPPTK